jgi:hypothetical protein
MYSSSRLLLLLSSGGSSSHFISRPINNQRKQYPSVMCTYSACNTIGVIGVIWCIYDYHAHVHSYLSLNWSNRQICLLLRPKQGEGTLFLEPPWLANCRAFTWSSLMHLCMADTTRFLANNPISRSFLECKSKCSCLPRSDPIEALHLPPSCTRATAIGAGAGGERD